MHKDISHVLLGYPLDKVRVLDTETTGLDSAQDEILSIAITDAYGNELFSSYVRPKHHREWPGAERVNHIKPRDVMFKPTIDSCAEAIREIVCQDVLIVGYNTSFDISFLVNAGIISWDETSRRQFDVMRQFALVHGVNKARNSDRYLWSKLTECANYYGHEFTAHDSLEDAKATAYCFRALLCDEKYYHHVLDKRLKVATDMATTQTKITRSNIQNIMGVDSKKEVSGAIVRGEVTRGKNKGKTRFECIVDNAFIGTLSDASVRTLLFYLKRNSPQELPDKIDATIKMVNDNKSVRCYCTPKPDDLIQEVSKLADIERPHYEVAMDAAKGSFELTKPTVYISKKSVLSDDDIPEKEEHDFSSKTILFTVIAIAIILTALVTYVRFRYMAI